MQVRPPPPPRPRGFKGTQPKSTPITPLRRFNSYHRNNATVISFLYYKYSVADLGRPPPPLAANFFSISCSFQGKKLNFIPAPPSARVGAPPVKILDPPLILHVNIAHASLTGVLFSKEQLSGTICWFCYRTSWLQSLTFVEFRSWS